MWVLWFFFVLFPLSQSLATTQSARLYSVIVFDIKSHLNRLLFGCFFAGWLQHHVLGSKWGYIRLPSEWWVDRTACHRQFPAQSFTDLCMSFLVGMNAWKLQFYPHSCKCVFLSEYVYEAMRDEAVCRFSFSCVDLCACSPVYLTAVITFIHNLCNTSALICCWRPSVYKTCELAL